MAGAIAALRLLSSRLDDVSARANNAVATVAAAVSFSASAIATLQSHSTFLLTAGEQATSAAALMSSTSQRAAETAEQVGVASAQVVAHAAAADNSLEALRAKIDGVLSQTTSAATHIDDLFNQTVEGGNIWEDSIHKLIDGAKIGATTIERLLELYGNAEFQGRRIRELITNADIEQFSNRLKDWLLELHAGAKSLDDIIQFIGQSNVEAAKVLNAALVAYKEGRGTLDAIKRIVDQIHKEFAGTDFEQLAEEILLGLQGGSLR